MNKIELHPEIILIENFLSKEECQFYIKKGINLGFEEAKVNLDGNQTMFKSIRNNERLMFFDKELAQKLWERIETFIPVKSNNYFPVGLNEMFRIYKYSVGERFKMHRDGSYKRNEFEKSRYSFIIYLNNDFEGGETNFRELFSVNPKEGSALIFRHPHKHEGKKILKGQKYVLRTDVMFKKKKISNEN